MFEGVKKQDLVKRITLYKIRLPKYKVSSKKELAKLKRSELVKIYKNQLDQDRNGIASVITEVRKNISKLMYF